MIAAFCGVSISLVRWLLNSFWRHIHHVSIYSSHYQLDFAILLFSLIIAVFLTFYLEDTNCRRVAGSELVDQDAFI